MMGCHRHCPRFLIIAAEFFACLCFLFVYCSYPFRFFSFSFSFLYSERIKSIFEIMEVHFFNHLFIVFLSVHKFMDKHTYEGLHIYFYRNS